MNALSPVQESIDTCAACGNSILIHSGIGLKCPRIVDGQVIDFEPGTHFQEGA